MPSPFPGMDPYIESSGRWTDFHTRMIVAISTALNRSLPKGFAADVETIVWFDEPGSARRRKIAGPDVYVAQESRRLAAVHSGTMLATVPTKAVFPEVERKTHRYGRIVDIDTNRVVTAIELVSPTNKVAGE